MFVVDVFFFTGVPPRVARGKEAYDSPDGKPATAAYRRLQPQEQRVTYYPV